MPTSFVSNSALGGRLHTSLSGVKVLVERLTAQCQTEATATDWDKLVVILDSSRINPRQPKEMTP